MTNYIYILDTPFTLQCASKSLDKIYNEAINIIHQKFNKQNIKIYHLKTIKEKLKIYNSTNIIDNNQLYIIIKLKEII